MHGSNAVRLASSRSKSSELWIRLILAQSIRASSRLRGFILVIVNGIIFVVESLWDCQLGQPVYVLYRILSCIRDEFNLFRQVIEEVVNGVVFCPLTPICYACEPLPDSWHRRHDKVGACPVLPVERHAAVRCPVSAIDLDPAVVARSGWRPLARVPVSPALPESGKDDLCDFPIRQLELARIEPSGFQREFFFCRAVSSGRTCRLYFGVYRRRLQCI